MKLYQITGQYQNLVELLDNPEFADNQDVLTALDQIEDEFNNKAVSVVKYIKNSESDIDCIDTEIKRLQAMKKARQNRIEEIKNYLKHNMATTGIDKISCPLFSISYHETENGKVELDEQEFLANVTDEDLVHYTVKPDKNAIKKALQRGEQIPGARLTNSQVLTIR